MHFRTAVTLSAFASLWISAPAIACELDGLPGFGGFHRMNPFAALQKNLYLQRKAEEEALAKQQEGASEERAEAKDTSAKPAPRAEARKQKVRAAPVRGQQGDAGVSGSISEKDPTNRT